MKRWKRKLGRLLFVRRLLSPWFAAVYALVWYRFAKLCRYGGVRRNVPVFLACLLFFAGYLLAYWIELYLYRKNSAGQVIEELWLAGNRVRLPDGTEFDYQEIRWYRKKKHQIWLFLKGHRFLWLDTESFLKKNQEYLEVMLTQSGVFATHFWRLPMAALLGIVTLWGALHVNQSAQPYNGKLSWVLQDFKHTRRVTLVHDNIYEDGLDGILTDIRSEVELPEKLYLINSFNLHFAADGTVLTLDTFVKGYDREKEIGGTYLISYNRSQSRKIEIYVNSWEGPPAEDPEENRVKDLTPLLAGMGVIPLEDTVAEWDQEVYGILYYGERSWYSTEGIRYIGPDGTVTLPDRMGTDAIEGPSISVFCPEDESITPVRYLYHGTL